MQVMKSMCQIRYNSSDDYHDFFRDMLKDMCVTLEECEGTRQSKDGMHISKYLLMDRTWVLDCDTTQLTGVPKEYPLFHPIKDTSIYYRAVNKKEW